MEINIMHLYPDFLNLYGDRGNIAALSKRLEWRGIKANTAEVKGDEMPDFSGVDILVLGGGAEREYAEVKKRLEGVRGALCEYIENGSVMLALCEGCRMLCELGALSAEFSQGERVSGNVLLECDIDGKSFSVSGFENHAYVWDIKEHTPLGRVVYGSAQSEGIIYKNLFATQLHGPLLPKNPALADIILSRALLKKYADFKELSPLDDELESLAHENIKARCIEK